MTIICWFSAGAASACATKLALQRFPDAIVYRIWMPDEHPDNDRFSTDVERWINRPIYTISSLYPSITAVFAKRNYFVGVTGAACTLEMKKYVRHYVERYHEQPVTGHVFGFTIEEQKRFDRLRQTAVETALYAPLIDEKLSSKDCKEWLQREGITLPYLYTLGFTHNNCIGCVKSGSFSYWHTVRQHFPDVYRRRAETERRFQRSLLRNKQLQPVFLDTLQPNQTYSTPVEDEGCSFLCGDTL